jgi:glycosyltransferase involved in cell wall biosynthesis
MSPTVEASGGRESPARIRILFVAHDAQLHGAQLALLNILRNLDRSRFDPFVVSPQSGPFTDEVVRIGVPISTGLVMRWVFRRIPVSLTKVLSAPWALLRTPAIIAVFLCGLPVRVGRLLLFLRRQRIDVIYTNTITVVDGAIAANLSGIPHIWHLHENIDENKDLLKALPAKHVATFLVPKLSTLIVVPSLALGHQLFGEPTAMPKLKVIHNGVDTHRFNPRPPNGFLHRELSVPVGAPLVGICGAIQESKGIEVFIRAASEVLRQCRHSHFLIIGAGSPQYLEKIFDIVGQSGLKERIHFIGWRADVSEIFKELQVLVIASKREAFGLTAIEGMATGLSVVATRCGGPEEVIEHGQTGFLVASGAHHELATRVVELLTHPELMHRMGRAARLAVLTNYELGDCVRKIESLLTAVSNGKKCRCIQ